MKNSLFFAILVLVGCSTKQETITPVVQDITESVYASGVVKSENQYQVFASVSGIVDGIFTDEGAGVEAGSPILSIADDTQKLISDNAKLTAEFNALHINHGKLDEARSLVSLTRSQMKNDSSLYQRQLRLWEQSIGSKVTLEQRELAYKNSKSNYDSAIERLDELKRQLNYLSKQAQNNFLISNRTTGDYLVQSKIKGKVYQLNIESGELVTPQTPIAIIGDDEHYLLELQVDEYDIVRVEKGMPVLVVLNSYRDSVFDAVVTKINPIMNLQSKTFTIEAKFVRAPEVLYPNISLEANILINTKQDALLIPRKYLLNDSVVFTADGEQYIVRTGVKDYQMIEILSGIAADAQLILPEQ